MTLRVELQHRVREDLSEAIRCLHEIHRAIRAVAARAASAAGREEKRCGAKQADREPLLIHREKHLRVGGGTAGVRKQACYAARGGWITTMEENAHASSAELP